VTYILNPPLRDNKNPKNLTWVPKGPRVGGWIDIESLSTLAAQAQNVGKTSKKNSNRSNQKPAYIAGKLWGKVEIHPIDIHTQSAESSTTLRDLPTSLKVSFLSCKSAADHLPSLEVSNPFFCSPPEVIAPTPLKVFYSSCILMITTVQCHSNPKSLILMQSV
jgi:hypothetical protein